MCVYFDGATDGESKLYLTRLFDRPTLTRGIWCVGQTTLYPRWLLTDSAVYDSISNCVAEPSLQKPSHKKLPEQRGIMVWANSFVRREHSACGSCFLIPGTNLASPSPYHSDNKLHFNLNLVHYSYYNTWAFSPYLFSTSPLDPLYQVYCFILSELLGLPGKAFMLSMKMSNTLSLTLFCFNEQSR